MHLDTAIADPYWLCYGCDPAAQRVHFVCVDDAALAGVTFIDTGWIHTRPSVSYPLDDVWRASSHCAFGPRGLIMHTAFSCSTLLARCLVIEGRLRTLRELPILSGLASACHQMRAMPASSDAANATPSDLLLDVAARLPARTFGTEQATLNKPSNVQLGAARDALQRDAESRAVVIRTGLPDFLASAAKRLKAGAQPWEGMLRALQPDLAVLHTHGAAIDRGHPLQLASTVWHLQAMLLQQIGVESCSSRVRVLDADAFLAAPLDTSNAVKDWLAPNVREAVTEDVVTAALSTHAKQPAVAFDASRREVEKSQVNARFAALIEDALSWSARTFGPWEAAYESGIAPLQVSIFHKPEPTAASASAEPGLP